MDNTLRQEFTELRIVVAGYVATQEQWNKGHDEHSREVLAGIKESTDKLFSIQATMVETVTEISIAAATQVARVDGIEKVSKAKFAGVNIRLKWLWGILGGGVFAVAIGFFLKGVLTYLKNPVT